MNFKNQQALPKSSRTIYSFPFKLTFSIQGFNWQNNGHRTGNNNLLKLEEKHRERLIQ